MLSSKKIHIIGAGLAGCEAAWQIAQRGYSVTLFEMRPEVKTEVHESGNFAELVCSNSFRSSKVENAVGLIKREMEIMGSLIIECAKATAVPAGNSLSVNRAEFGSLVTKRIEENANITVVRQKVEELDSEAINIIATGPVTEEGFARRILSLVGENSLYFYDAIAPILDADSIDYNIAFWADRYQEEGAEEAGDYLNVPLDRETYEAFVNELVSAEKVPTRDFEKEKFFEACLPIEVVASRGIKTLSFGILKPIGLQDKNGTKFHAVMQLRKENREGTALNMVGCQTRMKYGEQKRVFSMIPALRNAEFLRYGSMHRNTFLNSPQVLKSDFSLRQEFLETPSEIFGGKAALERLYFAGQITGVEGYIESAASGLMVGLNVSNLLQGKEPVLFPRITALGALNSHIGSELKRYQPSNVNYSMIEPLGKRIRNKQEKQKILSDRSLAWFDEKGFSLPTSSRTLNETKASD